VSSGPISRRQFGALAGAMFAPLALGDACQLALEQGVGSDGRITARPKTDVKTTAAGTRSLGLDKSRDAILLVPADAGTAPLPLLVLLHGAGGSGQRLLQRLNTAVESAGIAVLAPDSRGPTWDAIRGDFGGDVVFLGRALDRVFGMVAVDPARVTVGGFSDGATYALSLGLINGDVFPRVVAFSPGFVVDGAPHGKSRFFISHGTSDPILPIDQCSRQIVPALKRRGYDVTFREFSGGHEVPPTIATEAMAWIKS
jgi:phospholipase/carboxylesterase